jgi:hypothetical protein
LARAFLRAALKTGATGRGMTVVDALANGWSTEIRPAGRTVRFELDVDTATTEVQ